MKRIITTSLLGIALAIPIFAQTNSQQQESNNRATTTESVPQKYIPTAENLAARKRFEGFRFGIFLHWGIYSTFAQGEWYLNNKINKDEYAKAASAFYPSYFDADAWISAIKASGAPAAPAPTRAKYSNIFCRSSGVLSKSLQLKYCTG